MRASPHSAIQWILPLMFIASASWVVWNGATYIMAFGGIYRRSGGTLSADHDARLYHPFGDAPHCLGRHLDCPWRGHGN